MGSKKIVLDTSVFVAGIIGHGASKVILSMIIRCDIVPILCRDILREYLRVIHYPKIAKKIAPMMVYPILDIINRKAIRATCEGKIRVCRDPEDDKFIELSAKTSAPLITLDDDILGLRNETKIFEANGRQIRILRPEEFLREIKE